MTFHVICTTENFTFRSIGVQKYIVLKSLYKKINLQFNHLVVGLCRGLDGVSGEVVEGDDVPEHAHGLVEGAVSVVGAVAVLLQEVVLQQPRHLQRDLVSLRQAGLRRQADM